jgi:hypothetical protein
MLAPPDEPQLMQEIQLKLGTLFDHADRLYSHWQTQGKNEWLNKSKLSANVIDLSMALNVQACRLYRSLVELAQRGDAYSANILSRALFETLLATGFILKPSLNIYPTHEIDKGKVRMDGADKRCVVTTKKTEKLASMPSRDKRALMYVSFSHFNSTRLANKLSKVRGLKRAGHRVTKAWTVSDPREQLEFHRKLRKQLGDEWYMVIKHARYYSGMNVANLAKLLGFEHWYISVYHVQSNMVHGSDGAQHIDFDGTTSSPKYLSSLSEISSAVSSASSLFLACLVYMHKYIGFGSNNETALHGLNEELNSIRHNLGSET